MKTSRTPEHDKFTIPTDIQRRALLATQAGERIVIRPTEIIEQMNEADKALNGDSNDAEHDALYSLRMWLSEIFEAPERRRRQ